MFSVYSSKKTVDSVIGDLSKMITDLEDVQQTELAEATNQAAIADAAQVKRMNAEIQANRAGSIATKIEALLE